MLSTIKLWLAKVWDVEGVTDVTRQLKSCLGLDLWPKGEHGNSVALTTAQLVEYNDVAFVGYNLLQLAELADFDAYEIVEAEGVFHTLAVSGLQGLSLAHHFLIRAGLSPRIVQIITCNIRHTEHIAFPVLICILAVFDHGSPAERLSYLFSIFDYDQSGSLSYEEVFEVISAVSSSFVNEQEIDKITDELFQVLDTDGDGEIGFVDLIRSFPMFAKLLDVEDEDAEEQTQQQRSNLGNNDSFFDRKSQSSCSSLIDTAAATRPTMPDKVPRRRWSSFATNEPAPPAPLPSPRPHDTSSSIQDATYSGAMLHEQNALLDRVTSFAYTEEEHRQEEEKIQNPEGNKSQQQREATRTASDATSSNGSDMVCPFAEYLDDDEEDVVPVPISPLETPPPEVMRASTIASSSSGVSLPCPSPVSQKSKLSHATLSGFTVFSFAARDGPVDAEPRSYGSLSVSRGTKGRTMHNLRTQSSSFMTSGEQTSVQSAARTARKAHRAEGMLGGAAVIAAQSVYLSTPKVAEGEGDDARLDSGDKGVF